MTNVKLEQRYNEARIKNKEKNKKRIHAYCSGTTAKYETNAPATTKTDTFRVLKRIIGIALIMLMAVFAKVLTLMSAPVLFATIFVYVCIQTYLWWDIFEGFKDNDEK